jgi:hypothetical protein
VYTLAVTYVRQIPNVQITVTVSNYNQYYGGRYGRTFKVGIDISEGSNSIGGITVNGVHTNYLYLSTAQKGQDSNMKASLSGVFNWFMADKQYYTSTSGFVTVTAHLYTWLTNDEPESFSAVYTPPKLNISKTKSY